MRCAVCDEPFFRYDGVLTSRGAVCSQSCADEIESRTKRGRVNDVDSKTPKPVGKSGESR